MFHESVFLEYITKERRYAANTFVAYQHDLSNFISFCDKQGLTSVTEVRHFHIRSWIILQLQEGQSPRSVNRRLSCLQRYFGYLKKRGHLESNPMQKVIPPKTGSRLPTFIQESQLEALFKDFQFPDTYQGALHRLIMELLYATGMRRSELAALHIADIDKHRMVIKVNGKGNKQRLCPFGPYLIPLLDRFLELRENEFPSTGPTLLLNNKGRPMLPESIYYVVRKYLSLFTTEQHKSPHVLRHSFATHLSNRGADLNAIKTLLGHASLASTQVYMHNNINQLISVYRKSHPKGSEEEKEDPL